MSEVNVQQPLPKIVPTAIAFQQYGRPRGGKHSGNEWDIINALREGDTAVFETCPLAHKTNPSKPGWYRCNFYNNLKRTAKVHGVAVRVWHSGKALLIARLPAPKQLSNGTAPMQEAKEAKG